MYHHMQPVWVLISVFLPFSFCLHRQSSVEDLMKLARQFDESMQQDKETSESLVINLNECLNTSETKLKPSSLHDSLKDLKYPSAPDQVEAELHALFDCSTQSAWLCNIHLFTGNKRPTCECSFIRRPTIRAQIS